MKRRARAPLPFATFAVATAIVATYGLELAGDGQALCTAYGLVPARATFEAALASLFLHDPSGLAHIGGNLVVLVLIGSRLERAIGSARFAALYFAGGLAGAALHIVVDPASSAPLVGCSGALFAVLAVAAVLFGPAMLAFTSLLVAANIWHAFGGPGEAAVSFGCHIGGFAAGTAIVLLWRVRDVDWREGTRAARVAA